MYLSSEPGIDCTLHDEGIYLPLCHHILYVYRCAICDYVTTI